MPPGEVLAVPCAPTLTWNTSPGETLSVAETEPPLPPGAVPGCDPPCPPESRKVAVVTPAGTVNVSVPVVVYVQDEAPTLPDVPHGPVPADAAPGAMRRVPTARPITPAAGRMR